MSPARTATSAAERSAARACTAATTAALFDRPSAEPTVLAQSNPNADLLGVAPITRAAAAGAVAALAIEREPQIARACARERSQAERRAQPGR